MMVKVYIAHWQNVSGSNLTKVFLSEKKAQQHLKDNVEYLRSKGSSFNKAYEDMFFYIDEVELDTDKD